MYRKYIRDLNKREMRMMQEDVIRLLDPEWDLEQGYFGLLRASVYDKARAENVLSILRIAAKEPERSDMFERRFVELLWFMPTFMGWQLERMQARSDV